jgi:hypothetical protein
MVQYERPFCDFPGRNLLKAWQFPRRFPRWGAVGLAQGVLITETNKLRPMQPAACEKHQLLLCMKLPTPANRGLILLSTLGIMASSVQAQNWVRHQITTDLTAVYCVAASADLTQLVVGSSVAQSSSGQVGTANIYRSADAGATWQRTSAPTIDNTWTTILSSSDGTHLAALTAGGDLYVSVDSGTNWSPTQHVVGNVVGSADGLKLLALGSCFCASPNPLYHSSDGGLSWTTSMIPGTNTWSLAACSSDGLRMILFGLDTINHTTASVYLSTDFGFTWQKLPAPFKNWNALAASADTRQLVLANLLPESLYTSQDYGASWTVLPAAPAAQLWDCLASSADGTRLAAGTADGYGGFYVSSDGGLNWSYGNPPQVKVGNKTIQIGWSRIASSADGRRLAALANYYADSVFIVTMTDASATMTATPQRLHNGEPLSVVVSVENSSTNTLSAVKLAGGMVYSGTGGVALTGDFTTGVSLSLGPGQTGYFTNLYQATNNGRLTFSATVQATESSVGMITFTCSSPEVLIVPNGDLLVKRDADPADAYAGLGVFQKVPIAPQVVTNVVGSMSELSQFEVLVENNDPIAQTYTLQSQVLGNLVWKQAFVLSGDDQTVPLQGYGGITLPKMDPGTSLLLKVSVQDTNAQPGDISAVGFTLGLASDPTLTLDAVGTVTLLVPEIIVNSTGDSPNQDPNGCCCDTGQLLTDGKTHECTLRAALQVANHQPGKDIIRFQIPSDDPGIVAGVPTIMPATALPVITDAVVIDGWSQDPNANLPPVELSGTNVLRAPKPQPGSTLAGILNWPGAASGLELTADSCEIRGLVITYFPLCGILAQNTAAGTIIQGCHLGITSRGTEPAPNGLPSVGYLGDQPIYVRGAQIALRSAQNLVGGSGPKDGNLISGTVRGINSRGGNNIWEPQDFFYTQAPGLFLEGGAAVGNRIEGNVIGLDVTGTRVAAGPDVVYAIIPAPFVGVLLDGGANGNVIGPNNIISGNWDQIAIFNSQNNVVRANFLGLDVSGHKSFYVGDTAGVLIGNGPTNTVGGPQSSDGNVIGGQLTGVLITGSQGNLVQNNLIGVTPAGDHVPNGWGTAVYSGSEGTLVRSNQLAFDEKAGLLFDDAANVVAQGNLIHDNNVAGVAVFLGAMADTVAQNQIYSNGWAALGSGLAPADGVTLFGGNSITINHNSIFDNTGLGINLQGYTKVPLQNSLSGSGSGPNSLLNYPVLGGLGATIQAGPGSLSIGGTLNEAAGVHPYVVEYYAGPWANPSGYGEGRRFLGFQIVNSGVGGVAELNYTDAGSASPGEYVTATATDGAGNTSEFSKAALVQGTTATPSGISKQVQDQAPAPLPGGAPKAGPQPLGGLISGDGNGDGILDSQELNVCSFPGITGRWWTLNSPAGTQLTNVSPAGPPDFLATPTGYDFPLGFAAFTVQSMASGTTVVVTNFLHEAQNLDTVWAYGPTPDENQPHWYEFLFDGQTGARLSTTGFTLTFVDGGRGDGDLQANGQIVAFVGPARAIPTSAGLQLLSAVPMSSSVVSAALDANGNEVFSTNQLVVSTLTWPAGATNLALFYQLDLAAVTTLYATNSLPPGPDWLPVPESPAVVGARNFLTNAAAGPARFYQLRPF